MDEPDKSRKIKNSPSPASATAPSMSHSPPVALSQPGIGIIVNDNQTRLQDEAPASSATTFSAVSHILVPTLSSSASSVTSHIPINPNAVISPSQGVAYGGSGGYVDTSGGVFFEGPVVDNGSRIVYQNREQHSSDIGNFNVYPPPPPGGGEHHDLQQFQQPFVYSQHRPNTSGYFDFPSTSSQSLVRPQVPRQAEGEETSIFFSPTGNTLPAASTYLQGGQGSPLCTMPFQSQIYRMNEEARQYYPGDEQASLQQLQQDMNQLQFDDNNYSIRQPSISHEDIISEFIPMPSFDASPVQPQPSEVPTRSALMHTNSVADPTRPTSSHHEERFAAEPITPEAQAQVHPKKKKSVPRKTQKKTMDVKSEVEGESFAELFSTVINMASSNTRKQQSENVVFESDPVATTHDVGLIQGDVNVSVEGALSNQMKLEGLDHRASLFVELPLDPESIYKGGDVHIMKVCGPSCETDSVLPPTGITKPELPAKKSGKKSELKLKSTTTPQKPRASKPKDDDGASVDFTPQPPTKGRRKTVVNDEFNYGQIEKTLLNAAFGTVCGKDAAQSCEEEKEKISSNTNTEKTVEVSIKEKLVPKLLDLRISLPPLTEADIAATISSLRSSTMVTADDDSDADTTKDGQMNVQKEIYIDESEEEIKSKKRGKKTEDEDYTPRTTRSMTAKVSTVMDSDSQSSAGQRRKSHAAEEENGMLELSSDGNGASKTETARRGRKTVKGTFGGVRRVTKPKQFRKIKQSAGGQRSKETSIKTDVDESLVGVMVPSQDSFSSPKKRGRSKLKKNIKSEHAMVENAAVSDESEWDGGSRRLHYRKPVYNPDEIETLYGDKQFVIDVREIDRDPSSIYIWQILEPYFCLRRYYPCKFGQQQFYCSSPQRWYFAEEEFRNEEFLERFQPVVINIANTDVHFAEGWQMEESIIHYPYVDKTFFYRMAKSIAKISKTECLRLCLMTSMPLIILQNVQPSILPNMIRDAELDPNSMDPRLYAHVKAWQYLENVISKLLSEAGQSSKCDLNEETRLLLETFPKLRYSWKQVNKEGYCSACSPKCKRTPLVKVVFNTKPGWGTPYNIKTLVEYADPLKPENEAEYWCRQCSVAAKKYHRLAHFRYSLYRVMRQNIAKDVSLFKEKGVSITDQVLLWINYVDVNWNYTVFLDLQLGIAEVEEEFGTNTDIGAIVEEYAN